MGISLLSLRPDPTFPLPVKLPLARGDGTVTFTAKWRTMDDLKAFTEKAKDLTDREIFDGIVEGWDLIDEFTPENVDTLTQCFHSAPALVAMAYLDAYARVRRGGV